jgi:hypothetical protein
VSRKDLQDYALNLAALSETQRTASSSPWLPPGTASTWLCARGHINPRTVTTCGQCRK